MTLRDATPTITITRTNTFRGVGNRKPWHWVYDTDAVGDSGITIGGYSGLGDLIQYLRRQFGRDVRIVKTWGDPNA